MLTDTHGQLSSKFNIENSTLPSSQVTFSPHFHLDQWDWKVRHFGGRDIKKYLLNSI